MGERYIRVVMAVATATQNQKRNAREVHKVGVTCAI